MRSSIQRLFIYSSSRSSDFSAVLDNVKKGASSGSSYFLLFVGAKSAETNQSWCVDCRNADPILDKAFETYLHENLDKSIHLLVCDVVREEYKKPDYIFRLDSKVQLKCVPTLIKLSSKSDNEIGRLNDDQCQRYEMVMDLLES